MATEHVIDDHALDAALFALRASLPEDTSLMLDELIRLDNAPVSAILTRAIAAYWGQRLHETSIEAYEALRTDPETWQAYHDERAAWEATLLDGLVDE